MTTPAKKKLSASMKTSRYRRAGQLVCHESHPHVVPLAEYIGGGQERHPGKGVGEKLFGYGAGAVEEIARHNLIGANQGHKDKQKGNDNTQYLHDGCP
jgi:hypothetical protein